MGGKPEISFQMGKESLAYFLLIRNSAFPYKRNGEAVVSAICRSRNMIKRKHFYMVSGTAVEDFLKLCLRESHAVRRVRKKA